MAGSELGEVSTWIEDVEILVVAVFTSETIPVVVWMVIARCEVVEASLVFTSTEVARMLGWLARVDDNEVSVATEVVLAAVLSVVVKTVVVVDGVVVVETVVVVDGVVVVETVVVVDGVEVVLVVELVGGCVGSVVAVDFVDVVVVSFGVEVEVVVMMVVLTVWEAVRSEGLVEAD